MTNFGILLKLTNVQLAFIIIVPIILLAFASICLYFPISRSYYRKHFQIHYYKKIYQVALDNDFFLINQFAFKVDATKVANVDHILFGNKYIYVLSSKYYQGDLVGKYHDKSLIFISHRGKKCYTDNPYNQVKLLASKLSASTGIDASLMIGIILVNDNCRVAVESDSKQFYIIQRKRFASLIKAIESRPVQEINQTQLAKAVQSSAKQNKRKK